MSTDLMYSVVTILNTFFIEYWKFANGVDVKGSHHAHTDRKYMKK